MTLPVRQSPNGADDGPRTRCNQLGKLELVHMSFIRTIYGHSSGRILCLARGDQPYEHRFAGLALRLDRNSGPVWRPSDTDDWHVQGYSRTPPLPFPAACGRPKSNWRLNHGKVPDYHFPPSTLSTGSDSNRRRCGLQPHPSPLGHLCMAGSSGKNRTRISWLTATGPPVERHWNVLMIGTPRRYGPGHSRLRA